MKESLRQGIEGNTEVAVAKNKQWITNNKGISLTKSEQKKSYNLHPRRLYFRISAANNIATIFITFINGFIAGHVVSFVGSPTVSPTTAAACVGFLLPSGRYFYFEITSDNDEYPILPLASYAIAWIAFRILDLGDTFQLHV
jgi:hypothetical protein